MYFDDSSRRNLPHVLELHCASQHPAVRARFTPAPRTKNRIPAPTLLSLHNHAVSAHQRGNYQEREVWRIRFQRAVKSLQSYLRRIHGSLVRAWRQELDLEGHGKVTMRQVCSAISRIGFSGNIHDIWVQLDMDDKNFVTLKDLDPAGNAELMRFQIFLEESFGNSGLRAFKALDTQQLGQFSKVELMERIEALGWSGAGMHVESIAELLVPIRATTALITEADFIWLEHMYGMNEEDTSKKRSTSVLLARMKYSDLEQPPVPLPLHKVALPEKTKTQRWQEYTAYTRRREMEHKTMRENRKACLEAVRGLRYNLRGRHGNLVRAWRVSLDKSSKYALGLPQFVAAVRRENFQGNLTHLCAYFDRDLDGEVSLEELDPHGSAILLHFFELISKKYSSMGEAFQDAGPDRYGGITRHVFSNFCYSSGYLGDPDEVFDLLLTAPAMHASIYFSDFSWLYHWRSAIMKHDEREKAKETMGILTDEPKENRPLNKLEGGFGGSDSRSILKGSHSPSHSHSGPQLFISDIEQESSQSIDQMESQLWNSLERALSVIDTLASGEGQYEPPAVKDAKEDAKQRLEKQLVENLTTVRRVRSERAERGADQVGLDRLEGLENLYMDVINGLQRSKTF